METGVKEERLSIINVKNHFQDQLLSFSDESFKSVVRTKPIISVLFGHPVKDLTRVVYLNLL
jgi:hypothetical protein